MMLGDKKRMSRGWKEKKCSVTWITRVSWLQTEKRGKERRRCMTCRWEKGWFKESSLMTVSWWVLESPVRDMMQHKLDFLSFHHYLCRLHKWQKEMIQMTEMRDGRQDKKRLHESCLLKMSLYTDDWTLSPSHWKRSKGCFCCEDSVSLASLTSSYPFSFFMYMYFPRLLDNFPGRSPRFTLFHSYFLYFILRHNEKRG